MSIIVNSYSLRSQATKVDQEAQAYYSEYRALLADVETLTSSDYRGANAEAFKSKVNNFGNDFNKMKELMNEYARFLRTSADNYERTQENTSNSIKNLR